MHLCSLPRRFFKGAAREEIAAALRARHDKAAAAHREQAEATSRDFRAKESTEGRGEYAQRVASARERQRRAAGTAAGASRPSSRQSFEGGRSHTFEDRWEAFDRLRRNREAADEAERASFAKATYEAKSKFEDSEAARQKADRGYYERARAWHTGKASGAPPAAPAWKAVATPTKRNAKLGDSRHYKTLGIQGAADTPEIKKSYRTLARRHHPDKHRSRQSIDTATEMFKSINSAYQALKDGTTRRKYQLEVLEGREK
ncbi:DnaJ domain-containing protein [Pelagophyceae sp. CCMP2097]|nr:DnaJ domain-containing protein [Pelagophyceae sp. CCMP2097]